MSEEGEVNENLLLEGESGSADMMLQEETSTRLKSSHVGSSRSSIRFSGIASSILFLLEGLGFCFLFKIPNSYIKNIFEV